MVDKDEESPNSSIDRAISDLMKQMKSTPSKPSSIPPDVAVKIINTAISWEKVKHQITDKESGFDPDTL